MRYDHVRHNLSWGQIDLNLLRVFDVMMQERSVTRAAQRLGRTQSAVSHSVARLRELFNDELFSRSGGAMVPTPWALELAVVISRSLAEIGSAVNRNAYFDAANSTRNFRIGLTDYPGVAFLAHLIKRFAVEAPHATLNILHARVADLISQLRLREFECAIVGNISLSAPHLSQIVLGTERMVCAGWRGNPDIFNMTTEKYLAADHLQISADGVAQGVADIALRQMNLTRKVTATIPHYLAAPWILRGNRRLITVFGDGLLMNLSEASETVIVPPPFPLPDVIQTLIYERHLEADTGHSWLRRLIQEIAIELSIGKDQLYRRFGPEAVRGEL